MKINNSHPYACFKCRKSFKKNQFSGASDRFMTSSQIFAQRQEAIEFNAARLYRCPDCGGTTYFMGIDFKAPKKSDIKAWQEVETFINSGNVYYRKIRSDS